MRNLVLGLIAVAATTVSPSASAVGDGFYAGVGTLGVNLGYKVGDTENFGIRVGINRFDYGATLEKDDVEYKGDLKLRSWEVLADWHPFGNGFALTAGILVNENKFTGRARAEADGTLTINGTRYSGTNPSAKLTGRLGDGVTPYLGFGYVANPSAVKAVRLNASVGVVFQQPDATLTVSGIDDPRLEADRAAEERRLERKLDELRYYPVLTLGLSYSF